MHEEGIGWRGSCTAGQVFQLCTGPAWCELYLWFTLVPPLLVERWGSTRQPFPNPQPHLSLRFVIKRIALNILDAPVAGISWSLSLPGYPSVWLSWQWRRRAERVPRREADISTFQVTSHHQQCNRGRGEMGPVLSKS